MTMTVGRASCLSMAIGAMVVILAVGIASPALADNCSAVGNFTFTLAGGSGSLFLFPDGTVEMDFVPGHSICDVCLTAGRVFQGTYRTIATDRGCYFEIRLSTPPPITHTDTIGGVIAFEGRQLLFMAATSPDFGIGIAVRNDALTGR